MIVHIFVQARMSSSRLPGKMMANILGKPMVQIIVERLLPVINANRVVVLTSTEDSDDLLFKFLKSMGTPVFRGSLDNVAERFQQALIKYPCDYFVRICGDSPFIDPTLVEMMIEYCSEGDYDVISNICQRTFPKGQSVDIVKTQTFLNTQLDGLDAQDLEHVTTYFHRNMKFYKFRCISLNRDLSSLNQCIDTPEDILRIEEKKSLFQFRKEDVCKPNR